MTKPVVRMNNVTNYNLWLRFKEGDDDALALLFKKYADDLYSYGLKIYNNDSLVKDCLQEVFIQLIDKRKKIEITPYTHIYLFRSLRNKLFEELRSENRKQNILNNLSVKESLEEKDVEQLLIQSEERKSIHNELNTALQKLTKRQKEIIYLKYTECFSTVEIAELLQIDNASVRKLLYRSLKSLKKALGKKNLILLNIFVLLNSSIYCVDNQNCNSEVEKK